MAISPCWVVEQHGRWQDTSHGAMLATTTADGPPPRLSNTTNCLQPVGVSLDSHTHALHLVSEHRFGAHARFHLHSVLPRHGLCRRGCSLLFRLTQPFPMHADIAAYFVSFGPHGPRAPILPPGGHMKVFAGTVAVVGTALTLFAVIRSKGELNVVNVGSPADMSSPSHISVHVFPFHPSPTSPQDLEQGVPGGDDRVHEGAERQPYRASCGGSSNASLVSLRKATRAREWSWFKIWKIHRRNGFGRDESYLHSGGGVSGVRVNGSGGPGDERRMCAACHRTVRLGEIWSYGRRLVDLVPGLLSGCSGRAREAAPCGPPQARL